MKITKTLGSLAATSILSASLLAPALAADGETLPFASEVDTCIAAVTANLDLQNANRVRHLVKQKDRTGSSYAFAIETTVFSGSQSKRYAAYCVASGDAEPTKFRITEATI
jgi:hypothetical protein